MQLYFVECPVLLDWKCSYVLNSLGEFNGNQNSGSIFIGLLFDIDAELFKLVEDETVLGISRSGALGSRNCITTNSVIYRVEVPA